jgi:hypothetical protein
MWIFDLTVIVLVTVGCLLWATRVFGIATRDAQDLTAKLAIPYPVAASDWPELRVDAVVSDPDEPHRVLIVGRWPAHPDPRALLVLELGDAQSRERQLLVRWRDSGASISPMPQAEGRVLLCRRRTTESLEARVVAEAPLARRPVA